jgi:hypothetical protein
MNVPPSYQRKKSVIGFGKREAGILLVSIVLGGVLGLAVPLPDLFRIGLASLPVFIGIYLAIARDDRSQKPLEQIWWSYIMFWISPKNYRLGFDSSTLPSKNTSGWDALNSLFRGHESRSREEMENSGSLIVPALSLGYQSFLSLIAFFGLIMFVAWMYLGGANDMQIFVAQLISQLHDSIPFIPVN